MKQFDLNLISSPQFSVELPVSKQVIKMRSLLMKEYKNLYIAKEGGNLIDTTEQLISNAIQSDVDIFSLPVGDVEYLFLQLYMASTGNKNIPIRFKCTNKVDEKECSTQIQADIDIDTAYVPNSEMELMIPVNEQVTVEMRAPNNRDFDNNDITTDSGLLSCIMDCIHKVHAGEQVYSREEINDQIGDIMDRLSGTSFSKMVQIINNTPRITTIVDVTCPNCGATHKVPITGIADFFL